MAEFIYQMYKARKAHGDKVILDDVTLSFYPGAKIGVVGPNGMGKSTLLKLMAGMEEVSNGEARLTPGYTVGILQQEPPLDEDKTVLENIELAFGDVKAKIDRFNEIGGLMAEPDADFDALMAEMGELQDAIDAVDGWDLDSQLSQAMDALQCPDPDMPVNVLSGGERRRVALCRLLLEAPDLLLLDEPLSNLDAKLRESMRFEIKEIQRESGITVLYVTHDQTEAMTLGDRIVIMKDGVIQQIGTPQEVFDHPTNLFVAGFIGTPQMNFFDAELVKEDGRYAVVLENARVELSEAKQANLARKQVQPGPITLGVRPEHISLAGDASQAVRGTVDVAEMMGSAVHLHVDACGRDTIVILQTMDLQGAGHPIPATGSALPFTFGGNVAHVFDRETGRNLEV